MDGTQPKRLRPMQSLTPKYRRADVYARLLLAWIDHDRFPLLVAHIERRGYWPDIADDTSRSRRKDARATMQRLQRLSGHYGSLSMFTLELSELDSLDLYSRALADSARATVHGWLHAAGLVGTWTVERGRDGRTHAHAVTCSEAPTGAGIRRSEVYDLVNLAAYLVKPADARLNSFRPKDIAHWGLEALEEMRLEGAETYLAARAAIGSGKRLPHLRSDNLPRLLSTLRVIESPEGVQSDRFAGS